MSSKRASQVWRLTAGPAVAVALAASSAAAFEIELRDVASDRVERQRAYNRGATPLPNTPDLANLDKRLAAKGLTLGSPIFLRVFKETSELEVWMQKDKTFVLLDVYPICHWTGTLGPKLKEGDRQSPEGFYTVKPQQMRLVGRWQKAFNLGFPNAYDQVNGRTGSYILVHGGCSSVGCFAMTEQVQEEIYKLAAAAVKAGQPRFHVHAFPFRMTEANIERYRTHTWSDFWRDLKAAYDSFERTRLPPRVAICEQRYHVAEGHPDDGGDPDYLTTLRPPRPLTEVTSGYQPPRCSVDPEPTRMARQTSAPAERDDSAPAVSRPIRKAAAPLPKPVNEDPPKKSKKRVITASSDDDDAPQRRSVKRSREASTGARPTEDPQSGLGMRLAPDTPRIVSNGF